MVERICIIAAGLVLLAGCASTMDAMTPSVTVIKDDFDGKLIIRQAPVNAASSVAEPLHTLGFEWNEKFPDTVFVTAGIAGTKAITGVAFNADGKVITSLKAASDLTDFARGGALVASYRRFEMPLRDFLLVARARVVKMRLDGINDYTVSSFGPDAGTAVVNVKIGPFLDQVLSVKPGPSPKSPRT
jgi:hypothetical protein